MFGVARSGTNLIARMLDAHPQVIVALDALMPLFKSWRNLTVRHVAKPALVSVFDDEAPFQDYYFAQHGPEFLDLILGASADLPVAPRDLDALRRAVQARAALESAGLAARFAAWKGAGIRDLFAGAFGIFLDAAKAQGKGDLRWSGTKEVWTIEFVLPLARSFADARFIAIHRDPRAVIASFLNLAARDPSQAAHWVSYLRHWRKHAILARHFKSLPELKGRFLAVHYEDLVTAPEREGRRVASFLDVPFTDAMLTLGGGNWSGNSSFTPNRVAIEPAHKDHWRTNLRADILAVVEFLCRPEMLLLGYTCSKPSVEPEGGMFEAMIGAHLHPGGWRSDSGDPAADFAWELLRRAMLDPAAGRWPLDWVRRCFLVQELYGALVEVNAGG